MFETPPQIDKYDPLPRHAQIQRILRDMVKTGKLKPGDKIPAELHIADVMGVSKMTINKAVLALTASGIFVREVGRGTFVAPNAVEAALSLDGPFKNSHILGATRFVVGGGEANAAALLPPPQQQRLRITLSFPYQASNVLDSDYYSGLYRGVVDALGEQASGADLPSVDLALVPLSEPDYMAEDERAPADGRIIIAPRDDAPASIEALWESGKALVVLGASWPTMGVPSIDSDNVGGAMEAMRYLIGLGHERIAFVYTEAETANIQDRLVGYRRALSMAHRAQNPAWEVLAEKAWGIGTSAREQIMELLTGPERVTAVFSAGHYLALETLNIVREAGLRVPDDVSVIGFDDPLAAQLIYPPLTTVRQPLYEMGRRAGERVLRLLRGEEARAPIREVLPAQLMIRRSTAPAPVSPAPAAEKRH